MDGQPRALLGFHDTGYLESLVDSFETHGYFVIRAGDWDGMLDAVGDSQFKCYVMDTNLGQPGADTYDPALKIFRPMRGAFERGEVYFMSITGNRKLIEKTRAAGIPCMNRLEFTASKLFEMVESGELIEMAKPTATE